MEQPKQAVVETESTSPEERSAENGLSGFIAAAGVILAISYPVLALSTGVRALYQLFFKPGPVNELAATLSLIAALCYLAATVGFAIHKKWAWRLSVGVLIFETAMTVIVGILSIVMGDVIGRTVWAYFGADYGFFPLIQPLLGLAWLFHPQTLRVYGLRE
ncbi:MAG: hypothetical protein KDE48_00445 [Anaerolineales bacterium]|nr:hypothetical protein [Anaerolineales bacterium]